MTIEELADKLMDKSSETYWDKCSEDIGDEAGYAQRRYWDGWSDALEWVAKSIRDGLLCNFELKCPVIIGEVVMDGRSIPCYRYPESWSEEDIDRWRQKHGR